MDEGTPPWQGRLDDRFTFLEEVGAGASSRVYCAKDHDTGERVALKVLYQVEEEARFHREIALLSTIDSPFIPKYVHHGKLPSHEPFAALEWLEGCDLGVWLQGHALSLAQAADLMLGVARALADLHAREIVHRDIKPANIFLCRPQEGDPQPKLLDLGVAVRGTCRREDGAGGLVGTPSYMSPELASMEAVTITPACDVYSLCAVFYELLTGRRPHEHGHLPMLLTHIVNEPIAPLSAYNSEVPRALEALILKGLARKPEDRFPDGAALAEALHTLMTHDYHDAGKLFPPGYLQVGTLPPLPDEPRTSALLLLHVPDTPGAARLTQPHTFAAIQEAVQGFGGRLYALEAGVLLGLFGDEKTLGDEVNRALKAGLRIQRISYMAAAVVLGKIGGEHALQPALELAERLLQQPGTTEGVRVDGNSVRRARGEFTIVRQKGYSVVPGTMEWHNRKAQLLVGRDREQALLRTFMQRTARESRPQIVLIVGDDGMGKTSLCTWFYRKAGEEGFHLYPAVAHSETTDQPYSLMERLLCARAGIAEDLAPEIRSVMVDRFVARHANHEAALRFLLGADLHEVGLDEEGRRWSIWEAVSDVAEADLASGPLLWMVDDFHKADSMSRNLLSWLLASAPGGLGLIATTTPEHLAAVKERMPEDVTLFVHKLVPLNRADARKLVRRHMPDPDPAEVRAVVGRADGNPLFLEELARLYRRGTSERAVTRNIQITAQSALDRLSPEAGETARAAAVLGERGLLSTLATMLPEIDTAAARHELEEGGIFRPYPSGHDREKSGWRFKHSLTRDAVYHLLHKDRRKQAHEAAARYFDLAETSDPRKAARHYLAAGNKEAAARCLLAIAWTTHAAADVETTLHLVQKVQKIGLEGRYRQEMLYLRAAAHTWMGRLVPALDDVRMLLDEPDVDPALSARAACLGCMQVRRLSDAAEGLRMAETAIASATRADDPVLIARAWFHAAFVHYDSGDDAAVQRCLDALRRLDRADGQIAYYEAELEHMRAVMDQRFEDAVEKGKLALQYNRKQGNYPRLGACVANVGLCLFHLGRYRESLTFISMSCTIYARQRNRLQRYDARMNEGRILGLLERYDEAIACLDEAMGGFVKAGEAHRTGVAGALKARVLAARGSQDDLDLARRLIKTYMHDGRTSFLHGLETLVAGMDVYERRGEARRAAAVAERCLNLLDSRGAHNAFASEALAYAAVCLEAVGHPRAAEAAFRAGERLKRLLSTCREAASRHGLTHQIRAHHLFLAHHPHLLEPEGAPAGPPTN